MNESASMLSAFENRLKPMADGPSFSYEKLVRETRTRNSYENLGTRNWSVCHKFSYEFFSYEKLG